MSFETDRPFFPYREPEGKKPRKEDVGERTHDGRLLRVFFVADTRMDARLGQAAWHAQVAYADQLTDEQRRQLAKETGVAEAEIPTTAWLTTLEDRASPRPGKDDV
jgi:hypothetical protein